MGKGIETVRSLNKYQPLKISDCNSVQFQRSLSSPSGYDEVTCVKIYNTVKRRLFKKMLYFLEDLLFLVIWNICLQLHKRK